MIRNRSIFALIASGIFVASAANTTAQFTLTLNNAGHNKSVSKSYSRSIGNSWLGLQGYAYGFMRSYVADPSQIVYTGGSMTMSSAQARGYLRATATILKSTRELGRFDARADVYSRTTGVTASGSYQLRLAGYVVSSKSFTKTTSFPRFEKYISLFPTDPRATIPVGPFTLTLKGNAGVGIESSGFAMITHDPSVGVACTAHAWGQGRAKVEFGIWGFGVGAEVKAKFAEQTLGVSLWANKSGIRGTLDYLMVALSLKLRAYAYAFWGAASYSKTVLSQSWGQLYKVLIKL